MQTRLRMRKGFDWTRVVWTRPDSPPPAVCSYCSGALSDVPLMMWNSRGACISFCDDCVERHMECVHGE